MIHETQVTLTQSELTSILILSFRDSEGERVETVEIDLKTFSIIQSRGVCNKSTKHHNEIIDLVNANMGQIRKRMVA